MKKIIKISVLVFVLLLVTIVALPFVFQGKIEEAVKTAVNENINADVEWTDYGLSLFRSFPDMTISLDSLTVIGKGDFEGVELVSIPRLDISLDIISLFGDSAKINSFSLKNPYINVIVAEDGLANYDIAIPSEEIAEEASSEVSSFRLALDSYKIENGTISYLDNSGNMMVYLENLNHSGTGDFTSSIINLKTKTTADEFDFIFDNIAYINKATTDINLNLLMDLDKMRFDIEGNEIFLNELKLVADGFLEMPSSDIVMDIKYKAPETNITQLISLIPAEYRGDLAGVNAKGTLALDGFVTGTMTETELPAIGLDIQIKEGFLQYPGLPESINDIVLSALFSLPQGNNLDEMKVDISQLKMNIAGNPIDVRMLFTNPFTSQYIDAGLKANLDFDKLSKAFPIDETKLNGELNADVVLKGSVLDLTNQNFDDFYANGLIDVIGMNVDASNTYKMDIENAHFDITPARIKMGAFKGKIGESDFDATGKIDNFLAYAFNDEKLRGTFEFRSNTMNMADFMTSEESTEDASGDAVEDTYVAIPENLDFDLTGDIKKLIYDGTEMTNVTGLIGVDDGTAALQNVKVNYLEGSVILDGKYTTKDREKPLLDISYNLKNLDIAKTSKSFDMISQLAPIAKYCSGKFGSEMSFTIELGKDMFPLLETLSAKGNVSTDAVEIEQFQPLNEIAAKLKIGELAKQSIDNVKMNFSVDNGKVTVNPYEIKLDGMKTTISGWTSFSSEMDYVVEIDVPFSKLPQSGTEFANDLLSKVNLLGSNFGANEIIPVKIRVTGTMLNPKIDLSKLGSSLVQNAKEEIKEEVKELVQEKVEEVKEDAKAKAKEEADKLMVTATAQAEKVRAEGIQLADKGKEEAYKAAQRIQDAAKKPWEKVAAKLAADKAKKKADEVHVKALANVRTKADKIISDAQKRADGLLD